MMHHIIISNQELGEIFYNLANRNMSKHVERNT